MASLPITDRFHDMSLDKSSAALSRLMTVTTVFLSIYWLTNQLTSTRADVGTFVFDWERHIPFVDWTIVPYASIACFFVASFFVCRNRAELDSHVARLIAVVVVSAACYLLCPLRFTFERPIVDGFFGSMFSVLSLLDLPYNRAPSLHISVLVILWSPFMRILPASLRVVLTVWFGLIAVSVLTTYQHHIVDIPAGLAAALLCIKLFPVSRGQRKEQGFARLWGPAGNPS